MHDLDLDPYIEYKLMKFINNIYIWMNHKPTKQQ